MDASSSEKVLAEIARPKAKPFVQAIYEMAMLDNPIVGFSTDGTHLEIRDVPKLCEEVLPRYFKHRSLSSLFRQLNLYGFEKVAFDGAAHAFRHDFFRRDRADLLDQVSRSNSSRKLSKERRPSASVGRDTATSSDGGGSDGEGTPGGGNNKSDGKRVEVRRVPPPEALQFKLKPFVYATFEMVSNNEGSILGFSQDGRALEIRDVTNFAAKILPRYFKHNQFSSFARQMNMYGFEKIDSKSDVSTGGLPVPHTFFHESFRKGRMDLLPLIVRKTKGKRSFDDEEQEEASPKRVAHDSGGGSRFAAMNKPSSVAAAVSVAGMGSANGIRRVKRFIESLYEMAVESDHAEVGMDAEGTVLEIRDLNGFMRKVLPQHFNHKDFAAFIRQLTVYGFISLDKSRFRHPYFVAGREDLLDKIVPVLAAPADGNSTASHTTGASSSSSGLFSLGPADSLPRLPLAKNGLQGSSLFHNLPMLSLAQAASFQTQNPSDLAHFAGVNSGHPLFSAAAAAHSQQALASALNISPFLSMLNAGMNASGNGAAKDAGWTPGQSGELPLRKASSNSQSASGELPLRKASAQSYGELPLRKSSGVSQSGSLPVRKTSSQSQGEPQLSLHKSSKESQGSEAPLRKSLGGLPQRRISSQSQRSAAQDDSDEEVDGSMGDEEELDSNEEEEAQEEDSLSNSEDEEDGDDDAGGMSEDEASGHGKGGVIRASKSTPFVQAAYEIALLDNAAVGFNAAGTALEIRDETLFANEVLPKFFKHGNVSSFIRQLNMYSFEKTIGAIGSAHTFQHKHFRKDSPDLLALISRKQSKSNSTSGKHNSSDAVGGGRGRSVQKRGRKARFAAFASAEIKPSGADLGGRTKPTPFVHAVYELAMLDNDAIGWSKDGRALEIRNEPLLAERHLSKYFKHRQVSSLIRQLNMYGFEKTESAMGVTHTFQHEFFERKREDLLPRITRKHKGEKRSSVASGNGAMDEDEMESEPSTQPSTTAGRSVPETLDAIAGLTMLRNLAQGLEATKKSGVGSDLASILAQGSSNMFQMGLLGAGVGANPSSSSQASASSSLSFPSLTNFPILGAPFNFPANSAAGNALPPALHSLLQQQQNSGVSSSSAQGLFNASDLFSGRSNLGLGSLASMLFPQNPVASSPATGDGAPGLPLSAAGNSLTGPGVEASKPMAAPDATGLRPLPLVLASSSENGSSSEGPSSSGDEAPSAATAHQSVAVSS